MVVALAGVTFGVALAGCGDDDDGPSSAAPSVAGTSTAEREVCTEERKGGEITYAALLMTAGFDPTISTGGGPTGSIEMAAVYDMLVRWDSETRRFEPQLAESIEPNADSTEWTLVLRPGITFGNGDPMTAEVVKANMERHQDLANRSSVYSDAAKIAGMRVVDDRTLVFELAAPWGTFPYMLADVAGIIINPAVLAERADRNAFNLDPTGAGAGPYEVTRFVPGEEIVLEAKDDWWGGPVCIERIRVVDIPTSAATFDALKLGEVDIMFERDPKVIADIEAAGYGSHWDFAHAGSILMVYSGNPDLPTADVRVRRAINAAIDREEFDKRVTGGVGLPTAALIDSASPIASDVEVAGYDPDLARELVAEVKAEGWDGHVSLLQNTAAPEAAITVEGMLEAVGFTVDIDAVTGPDHTKRIYVEQNYQLGIAGSSLHEASPIVTLDRFWGPENRFTGFHDAAFDDAAAEVRTAGNDDEMKAAMNGVQEVWNETAPSVILRSDRAGVGWREGIHGLTFNHTGVILFDTAYVEPS